MFSFLKKLFAKEEAAGKPQAQVPAEAAPFVSASLPVGLMREGWMSYRFPDSDVVVLLPQTMLAGFGRFGEDETLKASYYRGEGVDYDYGQGCDFSATLHRYPERQREAALEFVAHFARKKGGEFVDEGTYRYFADPTPSIDEVAGREIWFWLVGIPGSVVVISLSHKVGEAFPEELEKIRKAIPRLVGELL